MPYIGSTWRSAGGTYPTTDTAIWCDDLGELNALDGSLLFVGMIGLSRIDPTKVYKLIAIGSEPTYVPTWAEFANGPRILNGLREIVYANDGGNDDTGNGSIGNPYLTPARAMLDAPQFCINGGSWVCDMTGSTAQVTTLTLPIMIGDGSFSVPASPVGPFKLEQNYNFLATPSVVRTITDGDILSLATDPVSQHQIVNLNASILTAHTLIGLGIIDGNGSFATIRDNEVNQITINAFHGSLATPFQIVAQTGIISIDDIGPAVQINAPCASVHLGGIQILNTGNNTYPGAGAFHVESAGHISMELCWTRGLSLRDVHGFDGYASYSGANLGGGLSTNNTIDGAQINFYRMMFVGPFDQFNTLGYQQFVCSFFGSDRIGHTEGAGGGGTFTIRNCYMANTFVAYYGGPRCYVYDVVITSSPFGVHDFAGGGGLEMRNILFGNIYYADMECRTGGSLSVDGGCIGTKGISVDGLGWIENPVISAISNQGTPGVARWMYKLLAVTVNGSVTVSAPFVTATGNANLDNTNFNRLTWTDPVGTVSIKIARLFAEETSTPQIGGIIGTVAAGTGTFDDTGITGDNSVTGGLVNLVSWVDFRSLNPDPNGPGSVSAILRDTGPRAEGSLVIEE